MQTLKSQKLYNVTGILRIYGLREVTMRWLWEPLRHREPRNKASLETDLLKLHKCVKITRTISQHLQTTAVLR